MGFPGLIPFALTPTQWATVTTYPSSADPWSVTNTKVTPGYSYFTPGVAPAAQEFNELFNSWTGDYNDIALRTKQLASFTPSLGQYFPFTGIGATFGGVHQPITGAVWDNYNLQWLYSIHAAIGATNFPYVYRSVDGSVFASSTTTSANQIGLGGIAVEPDAGIIVIWDEYALNFYFSIDAGDTFTANISSLPSVLAYQNKGLPKMSHLLYMGGDFYLITTMFNSGPFWTFHVWSAPATGYNASTVWTDRTSVVTAAVPGLAGNSLTIPVIYPVVVNDDTIFFTTNFKLATGGLKAAAIFSPVSAVDVKTNLPFPAGDLPTQGNGVCYSDAEDLIVVSYYDQTHNKSKIVSIPATSIGSTASNAWTAEHTFINSFAFGDLACCGGLYFQALPASTLPEQTLNFSNQLAISYDKRFWGLSMNWRQVVSQMADSDFAQLPQIYCNGNQVFGLSLRHWLSSDYQGLPPITAGSPV